MSNRMTLQLALVLAAGLVGCGDEFPIGTSYEQHHGIERSSRSFDTDVDRDDGWEREQPRRAERRDRDDDRRREDRADDRADDDGWGRNRRMPSDEMPSEREDWGRDRAKPSDNMPSDRDDWGRGRKMPSDEMPSKRDSFRKPLPSER